MNKATQIDAETWRMLIGEAGRLGGIRSITFGNGTQIVYDPVLTESPEDYSQVIGHPVWQCITVRTIDGKMMNVHRFPSAADDTAKGHDPISGERLGQRRGAGPAITGTGHGRRLGDAEGRYRDMDNAERAARKERMRREGGKDG